MAKTRALLTLLALFCAVANAANTTTTTTTTTAAAGGATAAENSTQCDEQLLFQKLYVLMPAINQCATEADYFINTSALVLPTDATLAKYCASANCTKLSAELDDAGLPSCTVAVGATDMPFKEFFSQIKGHCESAAAASKSNSKSAAMGSVQTAGRAWRVWLAVFVAMVVAAASM